ncbi:MAG TPA: 2-C-methyl-D-erythritol 2,4-cyclodiphosphate synthase [Ktedonobacteraceae bacterium]|jgi:2-C-methyl-D-erythritol 2,4-cyclodiphosphate synthase
MTIEFKSINQLLSEHLRIGTGIDFHSLHEGYPLTLAGVRIPFEKGFHVKRSDGDPVSHALVDALLSALGEGDIADWFSDEDGITDAQSINYLGELYTKLLAPQNVIIINVQIVILAEKPKLKPFFSQMKEKIANQLKIDQKRISIQGKTFEGKGIIGQQQGIETQAIISLLFENTEIS